MPPVGAGFAVAKKSKYGVFTKEDSKFVSITAN